MIVRVLILAGVLFVFRVRVRIMICACRKNAIQVHTTALIRREKKS